ncbi:hypothetical protein ABZ897_53640 [Nonomuraea sp. NPDC046802]
MDILPAVGEWFGETHPRGHPHHPGNDKLIPQRDSTLQMIFADI